MSQANPRLRTALVGFGWAGRSIWLPRLQASDRYDVVAVVDPVAAEATHAEVADLDPASVDLAIVAVPNHLHAEVAETLLRRGIATFVEKPVCLDAAEARALARAEREGGAVLLAGSASRFRSDVRALYELAATLGPVRHVEASWVRARGVPGRDGWFTRRDLAGGGALVDLGWHLLDAASPLLPGRAVTQVAGSLSGDFVNRSASRASWRLEQDAAAVGADVEDTARGFLVTDTGASLAVRASWASHQPVDVTQLLVEGAAGTASLRCTFGFSPNRVEESVLAHTVDGVTMLRSVGEPVGAEYDRQLAELPAMLADPASRGLAIGETRRTVDVIERLYLSASGPVPAPRSAAVR